MNDEGAPVHLAVNARLPIEAAAGDEIVLVARASCAGGHDRSHLFVEITAPDGTIATHALAAHADGVSETARIALRAPPRVGEHRFQLSLAPHEIAGTRYREAVLDVPVKVRPQTTSLAVWDVPSPVVAGARFCVKAGAKSTADCALAGRVIEVCDANGSVAAQGTLGDAPLPGTSALYWTEIGLTAPTTTGVASWSVRFEGTELELPHDAAATSFSLAVVSAPAHRLTVKVVEQETAVPIADVELRLGPYRGATGPTGLAEIALPKGRYELRMWKVGYEAPPQPVEIADDAYLEIAALTVPEEDPDALWRM
jgi:hypothetical protein